MFEIGDYVIYGTKGVCVVEEIGPIAMDDIPKDKLYYTLEPLYEKGSRVFTPVEHQKVVMRPIISKEEALQLLEEIPDMDSLWIPDDKMREQQFKEILKTCDCRKCIQIIKALYLRKKTRIAEGKKVMSGDTKYLKLSEDCLYEEFAVALGMDVKEVGSFIKDAIKNRVEL